MPQTCHVCRLPNRQEAEEALLAGEPLRNIAERFGTSPPALLRHKETHLPAKLVKAEDAREVASADTLTAKLRGIEAEARRLGKKAEKAGDLRTALLAVRELVRLTELAAKMSGELQAAKVQVNIKDQPRLTNEGHFRLLAIFYRDAPAVFLEHLRRALVADLESQRRGADSFRLAFLEEEYREALALLPIPTNPDAVLSPIFGEDPPPGGVK